MSDLIGQFREDDLPPSRVDIGQAVRSGRRARRTRTVLAVVGVAIALAAAASTARLWLPALRGMPTPPADDICATNTALPTPTAATDFDHFDPQRRELDVSAVSGYLLDRYVTTRYYQLATLTSAARDRTVTVLLHATGGVPQFDSVGPIDPAAGTPTDPVCDQPAFLLPRNSDVGEGIAWQWTPGAWVFVGAVLSGPAGGEEPDPEVQQSVAREVAQALRFGVGIPLTAPLSLPTPGHTGLATVDVRYDPQISEPIAGEPGTPVSVSLMFLTRADDDERNPSLPAGTMDGPQISVVVERARPDEPAEDEPPLVIDIPFEEIDGQTLGARVDGLRVYVSVAGPKGWRQSPEAGEDPPVLATPAQVFESIVFYPGARQSTGAWGPPISS